jgi:hypothetical protein
MDATTQIPREILEARIEQYLLDRADWVPTEELCRVFNVGERKLRDDGNTPGLCSRFALSRTDNGGGYIHVRNATIKQWCLFKSRTRKHAIKELMRVSALDKARFNVTRIVQHIEFERDTGQGLIPGLDLPRRLS